MALKKWQLKRGFKLFNDFFKVDINSDVDVREAAEILEKVIGNISSDNVIQGFYLDLKGKYTFEILAIRTIGQISAHLKKTGKHFTIGNASKDLKLALKEMGLSGSIQFVEKPEESPKQTYSQPAKKIDVNFVNPFIDSVLETLKVQCSTECTPEKPVLKENFVNTEPYAIAGVIGLTSANFKGSISICFPEVTFLSLMNKMLGENYTKITEELEDGAGEILNISFGLAKKTLNEKGYKIEKAIPTVIRGESVVVKHLVQSKTIILPFKTEAGGFCVEIGIEED